MRELYTELSVRAGPQTSNICKRLKACYQIEQYSDMCNNISQLERNTFK